MPMTQHVGEAAARDGPAPTKFRIAALQFSISAFSSGVGASCGARSQ